MADKRTPPSSNHRFFPHGLLDLAQDPRKPFCPLLLAGLVADQVLADFDAGRASRRAREWILA